MNDTTNVAPGSTSSEKLPSMSVMTPLVVPLIKILAPMTGPIASRTTPVIFLACCTASTASMADAAKSCGV